MRTATLIVFGALLLIAGAVDTSAQSFQGGLRGAVRDANAIIPGVEVTLTNEGTNIARSTVTNGSGEYVFAAVVPGTYAVKATLQGFKPFERRGLSIRTQQFITLDVQLELGGFEQEVMVTAKVPLIETSNASRGDVLDRATLDVLPTPGRNAFMMAVSIPGVVSSGDVQFNRQQDTTTVSNLSLAGGPKRGNNYLLDGVPITDMRNRPLAIPSIEGVEEVKVQINTYDVEMGHTGGGVFNTLGKSGTNAFRGSVFYQTRPVWGQVNNFFLERAGVPKNTDQYYRLYGGGVGGPIIHNRTFFWASSEGYRSLTTRNGSLIFPTQLERQGDFSRTFDRNGNLVVIYDPSTTRPNPNGTGFIRDPFPGNVIPRQRLSPVGQNLVRYLPMPQVDVSGATGTANYVKAATLTDQADQGTIKVEHKFTDKVSLSGMYLYNRTNEPQNVYWDTNQLIDPNSGLTKKRIQILAVNNTVVINSTTVASLRFGKTSMYNPKGDLSTFDMTPLGFPPSFVNSLAHQKFPRLVADEYGEIGGTALAGAEAILELSWYSWGANGYLSKYVGRHTIKLGADFRESGVDTQAFGYSSGQYRFDRQFTQGPNPNVASLNAGNSIASLLLGLPTGDPTKPSRLPISNPLNANTHYYSTYLQDDFRVGSDLTLNFGLRYEYETGLKEQENRFTVAFDRNAVSPLAALTGLDLRGGLRYAGQDGFPEFQGNPSKLNFSPRVGAAWTLNSKTVLRGGYGIFWAPFVYQDPNDTNYGQIGYTRNTDFVQGPQIPVGTIDNPFPNGLLQPVGNSLGLLTGVGGRVDFISQSRTAQRTQQFSVDVQRELPGSMAISVAYAGNRGDHLHLGGSGVALININQLDPRFMALGPALQQQVPNPFFGISQAGAFSTQSTLARGQLLRPFPQFGDVMETQVTEGKARYHAVTAKLDRRVTNGWGGRLSYIWSRLDDNQFAETNFFAALNNGGLPLNGYDLEAEYGRSLLDTPHAVIFAPIVQLPFGEGKRWLTGGLASALLGGWTLSSITEFRSGFPINIAQNTDNTGSFGGTQRPNLVSGVDPETPGSTIDRLNGYLNAGAWTAAAPFTFGNAPRTDPRVRTPFRTNVDMVFAKDVSVIRAVKGEIRVEMLNLTDTPKFANGPDARLGRSTFGTITQQAGFGRTTQLTFRVRW
jgi:hypothetical protein